MSENTEVATVDRDVTDEVTTSNPRDVTSVIASLGQADPGKFYSSINTESFDDRLRIATAMTTSLPIDENIGKPIKLANFIVQAVDLVNDEDGTVTAAPRCTLIDADGTAYHATSTGMLQSLLNIAKVLGEPSSWPEPVGISVSKEKAKRGSFFTIKFLPKK